MIVVILIVFKQKTVYELRISDWSTDVCSSDLAEFDPDVAVARQGAGAGRDQVAHTGEAGEGFGAAAHRDAEPGDLRQPARHQRGAGIVAGAEPVAHADPDRDDKIGRASWRVRVCQFV